MGRQLKSSRIQPSQMCIRDSSLIILDEIGRGTATFDGLSIAWAVAEYLHDELKSLSLIHIFGMRNGFARPLPIPAASAPGA